MASKHKAPSPPPVRAKATGSEKRRRIPPGELERIAERRRQVFALRRVGVSYQDIARRVGCGLTTAWEDVQAELADRVKQNAVDAESIRTMELERCDAVMAAMWSGVQTGNPQSAAAYLKAHERRCKLLGLDAPTRSELNGNMVIGWRDS